MTLGHVVLCVDEIDDATLAHELVHVAQYERWGPLFVPCYLGASGVAALRGGDVYRDNPFETAARRLDRQERAQQQALARAPGSTSAS
jgi:hypothetical protein